MHTCLAVDGVIHQGVYTGGITCWLIPSIQEKFQRIVGEELGNRETNFADGHQHDAQEFLNILLQALHENLNRGRVGYGSALRRILLCTEFFPLVKSHRLSNPPSPVGISKNICMDTRAEQSWNNEEKKDGSIINQLIKVMVHSLFTV